MSVDRTEVVIGANGKIAREYLDYLETLGVPTIAVYRSGEGEDFARYPSVIRTLKLDLRNGDWSGLEEAIDGEKSPRVIYLAVESRGINDLPLNDYLSVNAFPVKRLASILEGSEIPLIYVSSDMVLGGNKEDFSENSAALDPFGKYGISKLVGEQFALDYKNGRVVRFGNVLGTQRDFLSSVVKSIREGGNSSVWTNVFNRFTGVGEACNVLDRLADYTGKQRVFHVASSDRPMSRAMMAGQAILLLEHRGILPVDAHKSLNKTQHDFKDKRPAVLTLDTEITQRELTYEPLPILVAVREKIDEEGSIYLRN
jgi:dTDP-4-dehydrorhamnose reductase